MNDHASKTIFDLGWVEVQKVVCWQMLMFYLNVSDFRQTELRRKAKN